MTSKAASLLLNLQGAFSAYPDPDPDGLVGYRSTKYTPAESGFNVIYGILEAALGYGNYPEFENARNELRQKITFEEVSEEAPARKLVDYQTIGMPKFSRGFFTADGKIKYGGNNRPATPPVKHKEYLINAHRMVRVYSDKETIEKLKEALRHPWYDLYIGRACCIPSAPVLYEEC